MSVEDDFAWIVLDVAPGNRYKFTDGGDSWVADPWSRAYAWDDAGQMSMTPPTGAHLERYFSVGDAQMQERTVRVYLPESSATHVLYVHDGQNLFDPGAFFGGWHLNESAPDGLMLVGIDNTGARMDEYTQVPDHLGNGTVGGLGDAYADFVQDTVRPLIDAHYGEPVKVGTMGSSLGGLISLYIALRYPGEYDFAASLSGTVGWGSIGSPPSPTIIDEYLAAGHGTTALYIDSGGGGDDCVDSDGDGTEDDDPSASDNYCENRQLQAALESLGYEYDVDLWHWWEPGAPHNEAAWAARVFRPIQDFMGL
jgi:predicted alpha/beta superfamily hydrolase